MKNDAFIYYLQQQCPALGQLQCIDNTLYKNNEALPLNHLNLQKFFWQDKVLWKKISEYSQEDFFNLIASHLYYFNALDEEERQIPFLKEENFIIKKMRIIEIYDNYGYLKEYAYFIDNLDKPHLVFGPPKNLFDLYRSLVLKSVDLVTTEKLKNEIDKTDKEKKYFLFNDYKNYIENLDTNVTDEEKALEYQKFIGELFNVSKDAIGKLKEELKKYIDFMKVIERKSNISKKEKQALVFYRELLVTERENEVLVLQKSGYLHGIFLVIIVAILGIIISLVFINSK